jgi:hypothetical protein
MSPNPKTIHCARSVPVDSHLLRRRLKIPTTLLSQVAEGGFDVKKEASRLPRPADQQVAVLTSTSNSEDTDILGQLDGSLVLMSSGRGSKAGRPNDVADPRPAVETCPG